MASETQRHIQSSDRAQGAGGGERPRGLLRRLTAGRGTRLAAGLALALLLAVTPWQAWLADAALNTWDTATGTGALNFAQNNASYTGNFNTADGVNALENDFTGFDNTALGNGAGLTGNPQNANTTGSFNTFLGSNSGPGTSTPLSNATAIGFGAQVSESSALVLGLTGEVPVRVGIGTSSPQSLLQVGTPSTTYGSYLQVPMVTTATTPPASDCNTTTFVGRLVLQYDSIKDRTTLWSCSPAGMWTKLAQG
jgi:hypothetical protein